MKKIRRKVWQNFVYAMVILAMTLTCTGCHKTRTSSAGSSANVNQDENADGSAAGAEPLLVFVVGTNTIIQDYQLAYPDASLEVVTLKAAEFEEKVQKYGEPDVILANNDKGIRYWAENGYAADLSPWFDIDDSYNAEDYYPSVASVGRAGDGLYGFPVGLEVNYLMIRDEVWNDSAFSNLPEDYTSLDLLYAMEAELDYWMAQDVDEWRLVFLGDFCDVSEGLWESGGLQITPDGVTVDREIMECSIRGIRKTVLNLTEYQKKYGYFSPISDPREGGGRYSAVTYTECIAPQIGLVYYQSMNQELLEQDIHVLWWPMQKSEDNSSSQPEYAAQVAIWGMVGAGSSDPEAAYQMVRQLMDIPLHGYVQPGGFYETDMPFSVNRQVALDMIDMIDQGYLTSFKVGDSQVGAMVEKQPLTDELRTEMEKLLNNITMVYALDDSISDTVDQAFMFYRYDEEINYDLIYGTVLEAMQGYAK